jgi:hypothetical protein
MVTMLMAKTVDLGEVHVGSTKRCSAFRGNIPPINRVEYVPNTSSGLQRCMRVDQKLNLDRARGKAIVLGENE